MTAQGLVTVEDIVTSMGLIIVEAIATVEDVVTLSRIK